MATHPRTQPVEDSIAKIHDEVAVGEDMQFQRRWWRFEWIVWAIFGIIIALDLAGVFGGGPLSRASAKSTDGSMRVSYERVERYGTPSIMTIQLSPSAIQDGKIRLWIGDSAIKPLGNQRIIPQPLISQLAGDGVLYTFLATASAQTSVEFQFQPATPGRFPLFLKLYDLPGNQSPSTVHMHVIVMP